jgi:alkanesulfonate monooxygenase SsuD/methylene tetrahydromethanopterin reductase-like flavin-dependent oxidoreductase (luciferase family)
VKIGIGLPNTVKGIQGDLIVRWARRAEERGFSSLGTIDRIAFPSFDSLASLAAAGAVTERIGLLTDILLAPTRHPVLLAKEAATIDQLTGGRLTLGLAPGSRADDYAAVGLSFSDRGRRFDQDLDVMFRAWKGEPVNGAELPVSPRPANGDRVRLLFGGMSGAAADRAAKVGDGWTAGGAPFEATTPQVERVRIAWKDAGRHGQPYLVALSYFGLGDTEEASKESLRAYYGYTGDYVEAIAAGAPRTPEAIKEHLEPFAGLGFDEFILFPTVADLVQVDLLADAVL